MRKNIIFLTLILTYYNLFSQNGEKNFIDQNYIEITGKVETEIIPDEIFIDITINENDSKNKSIEDLEQEMITRFKNLKIDVEKDFSIKGFNGVLSKYFFKKNDVVKSKDYQLLVHDGLTVSQVFSELEKLNISSFHIGKVSHSEIEKLLRETKIKALKIAKEKAIDYATAIGQNIGKALFIQEISNYNNQFISSNTLINMSREYSSLEKSKETFLDFESIKLSASVLTRFELK